jgi:hypothetical protein
MKKDDLKNATVNSTNTALADVNFTASEVINLIQNIYSEFAETNWKFQNTNTLKAIIKTEVEQHPLKPLRIFK